MAVFKDDEERLQMIKDFMPSLINSIDKDLYRFKFRDVINLVIAYQDMRCLSEDASVEIVSCDQMANIHRMVNMYLVEYLSQ
jgi:hypothetical protein